MISFGMATITESDAIRLICMLFDVINVVNHSAVLFTYLACVVVALSNLALECLVERFGIKPIAPAPVRRFLANQISFITFLRAKLSTVISNTSLDTENFRAIRTSNVYPSVGVFACARAEQLFTRWSGIKGLSALLARCFSSASPIWVAFSGLIISSANLGAKFCGVVSVERGKFFSATQTLSRLDGSLRFCFALLRAVFTKLRWCSKKFFTTYHAIAFYFAAIPGRVILFLYKECGKPKNEASLGAKLFMRVTWRRFELLPTGQAVLNHVIP